MLRTKAKYRDPSAWTHFVVAFDTTQSTSSDRVKIYVNGTQVTSLATSNYPSQDHDTDFVLYSVRLRCWYGTLC